MRALLALLFALLAGCATTAPTGTTSSASSGPDMAWTVTGHDGEFRAVPMLNLDAATGLPSFEVPANATTAWFNVTVESQPTGDFHVDFFGPGNDHCGPRRQCVQGTTVAGALHIEVEAPSTGTWQFAFRSDAEPARGTYHLDVNVLTEA